MSTLRSKLIRLAHVNPEVRAHVLPLLKEAAPDPKQVGNTILQQMGGTRRLQMMLGAKHFLILTEGFGGVSFQFSNRGAGKPNYVKIVLEHDDVYTVTFGRIRGYSFKETKEYSGVYADGLRRLFERETGLYLTL